MLYLIVAIISIGLFGFLVVGWVCNSKYSHTHKIAGKT
jgi:NADH:ubiquinone oxidoreductase subunit H